ncbi:thiol reductant ABC exporter subunit CydC [Sporomusa acidovorans]|uniref:ABC transporter ATP-binding/permease protein n=1 Tax=Sporomusa acidovorans (strain ATCC 49682 / DSM 3132 / Mol) TaxID=1123286 RepID=A0ABZ3IWB9_SPOA4|nr:thiol reductant ABC exporter subunit CydC [Sporomusa acidovorans]OZC17977.1 putative ABC transporter ATP-binding protein [Sporomusa acidovorans DSM 3132]SDF41948.1 ATP-binding cassette, subfamily C, CydC [Sporomusa acidovorans]
MLNLLAGKRATIVMGAAACVLGSLTVYANVGLLAASAWLISAAALHPPVAELSLAIVGVRFFGLARAICRYGERYVSHEATFRLLADIRAWLYGRLEPLAPGGLTGMTKGDVFSCLVADVETLKYFYLRAVFPVVTALLVMAATMLLVAWLAPWLAWPLFGLMLLTGCVLPVAIHGLGSKAGQPLVAARACLNRVLADSIDGLTELTTFGQAKTQAEKVAMAAVRFRCAQQQANRVTALADALGMLGMQLTVLLMITLAAPRVAAGQLDGVYLAVVALAVQAGFEAILPLPAVCYYLQESAAAMARLKSISGKKAAVPGSRNGVIPDGLVTLSADQLSFFYNPDQPPTLSNISFNLTPGKRLAVVGASGAGKSTLAGTILRFWDYQQGRLLLNGGDIRHYAPEEVRRVVSVVSQDTYLFNATIKDNILLARPAAGAAELAAAIEAAMLGEFIARLPQGLNTRTGQNGLALSGGERQRIALARVILKAAPIWLLDEPTAGLDAAAEQQIMERMLQAAGHRSVFLITHRLTGLQVMDEIIVLDKGKIAEQGTWGQLMRSRGLFYQMWTLQQDLLNNIY